MDPGQIKAANYHYARHAHGRTGYHCASCFDETAVDSLDLREHLRGVAANHVMAAEREGRRLSIEDIAQLMLTRARALRELRLEFKLAETHPRLTGGTPAELRERLYGAIWGEARALAQSASSQTLEGG